MATGNSDDATPSPLSDIPWEDVVRFVRQLSHDLRNHLNAAELQSAFIGEIATDPEIKSEVTRLRGMLGELSGLLQKMSSDMGHARPNPIPYRAKDLMEDLRRKVESGSADSKKLALSWEVSACDGTLEVDPQLFPPVVEELLANAARENPDAKVTIQATIDRDKCFVLTLVEPKENFDLSTEEWGRQPLRNITQRHYGLGLNRARIIVESHGGKLGARYDKSSKTLLTTITLPIAQRES
jgi:K+-sensing histidine kinase KdpD